MIHPVLISVITESVGEIRVVFNWVFSFTLLLGGMTLEIESA